MLGLLADENFNGYIVRGLLRRRSTLILVRVQDVGLGEANDPAILAWAAVHNYILLTPARARGPDFAYNRVEAGQSMPGVFILNDRMSLRQTISITLQPCHPATLTKNQP